MKVREKNKGNVEKVKLKCNKCITKIRNMGDKNSSGMLANCLVNPV